MPDSQSANPSGSKRGKHPRSRANLVRGRTGRPAKATDAARKAFAACLQNLAPEAEGWIRAAAEADPGRAAEVLLRLSERFIPVLSRQEVVGDGGGPVKLSIHIGPALEKKP